MPKRLNCADLNGRSILNQFARCDHNLRGFTLSSSCFKFRSRNIKRALAFLSCFGVSQMAMSETCTTVVGDISAAESKVEFVISAAPRYVGELKTDSGKNVDDSANCIRQSNCRWIAATSVATKPEQMELWGFSFLRIFRRVTSLGLQNIGFLAALGKV